MFRTLIGGGVIAALLAGCAGGPYGGPSFGKTAAGAAIGAASGAGLGAIIGHNNRGKGALIGAGVGTLLGAGVGAYMDHQESQLREQLSGTGIEVQRNGNDLVLNMPSNVTFSHDSDKISPQAASALTQVSATLNQYPETQLTVMGHTDSDGADNYNLDLSRRRAGSVSGFLIAQGVAANRLETQGKGESQPIASNATEEGKAQNRRVELVIRPNQAAQQPQGAPQGQTYPQQQPGGYPQQTGGYPQQPGNYPRQTGGYPQQPGGYPQQPGYPQQTGSYPPRQPGGYFQPAYPR